MTYRDNDPNKDNDLKKASRFTVWGLVALVLIGGMLLWGYRANNNDLSNIEPAAGEMRVENSTGTMQDAPATAPAN